MKEGGTVMATSSLKKSFVINSKKEADAFVQMFDNAMKHPLPPIKEVDYSMMSKDEIKELIASYAKQS